MALRLDPNRCPTLPNPSLSSSNVRGLGMGSSVPGGGGMMVDTLSPTPNTFCVRPHTLLDPEPQPPPPGGEVHPAVEGGILARRRGDWTTRAWLRRSLRAFALKMVQAKALNGVCVPGSLDSGVTCARHGEEGVGHACGCGHLDPRPQAPTRWRGTSRRRRRLSMFCTCIRCCELKNPVRLVGVEEAAENISQQKPPSLTILQALSADLRP